MKKCVKVRVIVAVVFVVVMFVTRFLYDRGFCSFDFLQRPIESLAYPFEKVFSFVVSKTRDTKKYFGNVDELYRENEKLKKEVNDLEKYISKIIWLDYENQKLRNTLMLKDFFSEYKFIGANIIARDASNWFEIFKIDIGLDDGVYENSFVIFDKGLVGRVYKVSKKTANVISLIDRDSVVGVRFAKTGDVAVLKGDIKLREDGCCKLEYIPENAEVNIGDIVETSGIGGYFPKGIEVGRVVDIINPKDKLERHAIVRPSVDLKRIDEVLVSIKS